jgi:hypothetical protein
MADQCLVLSVGGGVLVSSSCWLVFYQVIFYAVKWLGWWAGRPWSRLVLGLVFPLVWAAFLQASRGILITTVGLPLANVTTAQTKLTVATLLQRWGSHWPSVTMATTKTI